MKFLLGTLIVCAQLLRVQAAPLEMWISSQQDKDYYDKMVSLYQAEVDKEFEANVVAYGFRELPDKLSVVMKTGVGAPDIVQLDEVFFGPYSAGEVPFVDLTPRLKEAKLKNKFLKSRLDLFTAKDKVYGLPQSLSAMVMYYRADLLEAHGVDPSTIKTWDDFRAAGEKMAENDIYMLGMDASYFEALLRQRGSQIVSETGVALPDFAKAEETMTFLVDMFADGIAMTPERGSIFDPLFFNGNVENDEVACIMGADWFGLDMIQQFLPHMEGKWGVMALPKWSQDGPKASRTSSFAGQGLLIYNQSKEVDRCWKFMEWVMTNAEANNLRFSMGNSFPAYKPAWKDPKLLGGNTYFGGASMGKLLVEIAEEVPTVAVHPKRAQALFMMQENYFSAALHGAQSPKEMLQEFKQMLEQ